jgi:hypothetical protein
MRAALAGALGIALALAAWSVRRPYVMMQQVGLPGWRPESGRRCEDPVSTPWRHCYRSAKSGAASAAEERVSFDRRTGHIAELERMWYVRDSAAMLQQEDSVVRALARWGGTPIDCPSPASPDGGAQRIAAWRFRDQDVRMIRSRWGDRERGHPTWMIQISGFPIGYSGCQSVVPMRRLLTPAEMLEAVQRWLVEQTD